MTRQRNTEKSVNTSGQRVDQNGASAHQAIASSPPGDLDDTFALRAARSNCTILITGETGVGKGHLARWLHEHSSRAAGPFVPVNCGAIPESIIDSQLFGHRRGAFSGATSDHSGLVRAAAGGTLLLDEVSELPATAQTRLLRLLQDREVQPVGEPRPIIVNVRIIAATNCDLHARVADGRFRDDLLFRLDIIQLHVEPLRHRAAEIPGLVKRFNQEFAELYEQPLLQFTAESLAVLGRNRWPGNIRQLRAIIERLHVLCRDEEITPRHLREVGRLELIESPGPASLEEVKLNEVRRVLACTGGSVAHAAKVLGVHRSTVYRWLRDDNKS